MPFKLKFGHGQTYLVLVYSASSYYYYSVQRVTAILHSHGVKSENSYDLAGTCR